MKVISYHQTINAKNVEVEDNCITVVRLNHLTGMGKGKVTVRKAIAYLVIPPSFLCGFSSTNFLRAPLLSFQAKCLSLPDNLENGYNSCHTVTILFDGILLHSILFHS
ncbi:hypothetical protein WUBG_08885 [Wuchereria bancrofti]|uniref:Uncharacterized protein n=1 Tax=Wuchereria bancrofti TaxID=6293 RepID=J9EYH4_WUCBA|nr:hypothetical protein WUBG_08885 [Wuchereria bancrofti]